MASIVAVSLIGLFASVLGASAMGFIVWRLFSKRLIETKDVYEEPAKKRQILVPGDGVYVVHEKRKCRYIDEQLEWAKEENKRDR